MVPLNVSAGTVKPLTSILDCLLINKDTHRSNPGLC